MFSIATVIAYLFTKLISDLIQIFGFEECLGTPFLDPFFVKGMIVKRKDRFDILPSAGLWGYSSTTFLTWARDHVVDNAESFSFTQWLTREGLLHFSRRLSHSNTVKPILDSRPSGSVAFYTPHRFVDPTWTCTPHC